MKIGGVNINNLRYADDTVLLAESEQQLQQILDSVNTAGKEFGMKMNTKKTKMMLISRDDNKSTMNITIDGTPVEQVNKFVYLGELITDDGKCDSEILRRIEIAQGTFMKMARVLTSGQIALTTRKRLLKCYGWTTLLYGSETWTITSRMSERLAAFEMWLYRKMLKIQWTEKITNKDVISRVGEQRNIMNVIRTRILLDGRFDGCRARGRPRVTWCSNITEWTGLLYSEAVRMAEQRTEWWVIASNPLAEDGT